MKRSIRYAGSAVAITVLTMAISSSAFAGCPITVTFKNKGSAPVVISKSDSKVATKTGTGFSVWRKFLSNDVSVGPKSEVSVATQLHSACALGVRKFKFKWQTPSGSTGWVNKKNVVIPVDRKVKVRIKP